MFIPAVPEAELITRLISGDERAFEEMVRAHTSMLLHAAVRRVGDKEEAEDMVQEIFLKLWENRASLNVDVPLEAYLRTCLKFRIIRLAYRNKLHEKVLSGMKEQMDNVSDDCFSLLMAAEIEQLLTQTSSQLPETMFKIFQMRQRGIAIREIASTMDVAEQTVKNYYSEALRRLREVVLSHYPDIHPGLLSVTFYCLTQY